MVLNSTEIGILVGIICLFAVSIVVYAGYYKLKYSHDHLFILHDASHDHKSPAIVQAESRARNYRHRAKQSLLRSASVVGNHASPSGPANYTITDDSPDLSDGNNSANYIDDEDYDVEAGLDHDHLHFSG